MATTRVSSSFNETIVVPTNHFLAGNSAGSAKKHFGMPISLFLSSIYLAAVICLIQVLMFCILRRRLPILYEPRTILCPQRLRSKVSSTDGFFSWVKVTFQRYLAAFLEDSGIDAYLFLRYLLFIASFLLCLSVISIPLLIPINCTGNDARYPSGAQGLDRASWSNISSSRTSRYYAHLTVGLLTTVLFSVFIKKELAYYLDLRHDQISHPPNLACDITCRTVLIRGFGGTESDAARYFSMLFQRPEAVVKCLPISDNVALERLVKQRTKVIHKIETLYFSSMQGLFIKKSEKRGQDQERNLPIWALRSDNGGHQPQAQKLKYDATGIRMSADNGRPAAEAEKAESLSDESDIVSENELIRRVANTAYASDAESQSIPRENGPLWKRIFRPAPRSKDVALKERLALVRLGAILVQLNIRIEELTDNQQLDCRSCESFFVIFDSSLNAQIANRMAITNTSKTEIKALIHPNDLIWEHLSQFKWYHKLLRSLSYLLTVLVIVGWAFPVAFVSIVTQITYLAQLVPGLRWLHSMHNVITWFLGAVGAPFLLGLLLSSVPVLFRFLSWMKRPRTWTEMHLDMQKCHFLFLFVQVFLVITISSGITAAIYEAVLYPTSLPKLLATDLPKAANFFSSYIVIQGITISGSTLVRIPDVFNYARRSYLSSSTGTGQFNFRFMYNPDDSLDWGSLYPVMTNLAVITITYSVTSPLVLILSTLAFAMVYFCFKYRIMFCHVSPFNSFGVYYPIALFQLYAGIYCMQICLVGLFFLVRDQRGDPSCRIQGVVMTFVLIATALYHYKLHGEYAKSMDCVPIQKFESDKKQDRHSRIHERTNKESVRQTNNFAKKKQGRPAFPEIEKTLEQLDCEKDLDKIITLAYQPRATREYSKWIWLPPGPNGATSLDAVSCLLNNYKYVTSEGIHYNEEGILEFSRHPPSLDKVFNIFR